MKKIVALVLTLVLALSLATVAFGATTPVLTDQYTKTTNATPATDTGVSVYFYKAVAPTTGDDGEVTELGNIAYYMIDEDMYVSVATLAEADLIVASDAAYKHVTLYLAEANPFYVNAFATTNFGTACGQYVKPTGYNAENAYYVAENCEVNGDVVDLLFVADEDGEGAVMVGGKLIVAECLGKAEVVAHVQTPVVTDGKLTGYKCANCGVAAVKAANYASVPTNVTPFQGSDGAYYYFAATAAATTTTGVSSAKTFDAGVALYAGMALMSVAGSAVVIGKKKEF